MKENFILPNESAQPERESLFEDIPEFGFNEGVEEIKTRVLELLQKQPNVVLGFSGSAAHVGKTALSKAVFSELNEQGIESIVYHGIEEVESRTLEGDQRVFIFEQIEWGSIDKKFHERLKEIHNNEIKEALEAVGRHVGGVDLWVGIYRPDIPFQTSSKSDSSASPLADIIIRNDFAIDKPNFKTML